MDRNCNDAVAVECCGVSSGVTTEAHCNMQDKNLRVRAKKPSECKSMGFYDSRTSALDPTLSAFLRAQGRLESLKVDNGANRGDVSGCRLNHR